jgi:hypothetical protein
MKTKINRKSKLKKYNKTPKHKKGGGWFSPKVMPQQCDPNKLSELTTSDEMHGQYQTCCPKTFWGSKNSSPYCKQLDLNFQSASLNENNAKEFSNDIDDSEINNVPNTAQISKVQNDVANPKPWYKFWGGKTKRKHLKKNKKSKRRHYKK